MPSRVRVDINEHPKLASNWSGGGCTQYLVNAAGGIAAPNAWAPREILNAEIRLGLHSKIRSPHETLAAVAIQEPESANIAATLSDTVDRIASCIEDGLLSREV
jgi:hypothetical protein